MAEKKANPKLDAQRVMREARYEERRAKRQAEVKELQKRADAIKPKPVKRPARKKKTGDGA